MLKTNRLIFMMAGAFAISLLALPAMANEAVQVQAKGQAAIYGKDVSQARDKAIDDARRKAVEQAIGSMVSSETVTENFQLISDKILSKSSGYVRRYKILSEGSEEGIYQVTIEAMPGGVLNSDLQASWRFSKQKMPRVLAAITEQNIGGAPSAWWSTGASVYGCHEHSDRCWRPKGVKFVEWQVLMVNSCWRGYP